MEEPHPRLMETSCGFVLVNFDSVLLLQYPQGHWSYPKGHVEGEEDHYTTARRELAEETGIEEIEIDSGWRDRTEYTFMRKGREIPKQVFWYIAETETLAVKISHEHREHLWLEWEGAMRQLTHTESQGVLAAAHDHMKSIGR